MRSTRSAFTLIELLVVVAIISILLALLMPALDQAVYQAELAVCATRQHAAGAGAVTYTMDYKRRYPFRAGVFDGGATQGEWLPNMLADTVSQGVKYDDRPMLKPYIAINAMLNDPLSGKVDFESAERGSAIMLPINLYFGWTFGAGEGGMVKLGDRFSWTADGMQRRFNILISDWEMAQMGGGAGWIYSSHPDSLGQMLNQVLQDQGAVAKVAGVGPAGNQWTLSRWLGAPPAAGSVDANFTSEDLAVARVATMAVHEFEVSPEERLAPVPEGKGGLNWPTFKVWLAYP